MPEAVVEEVPVSKAIHIAKGLSLPIDVVTQTIAILARKGSGKTFTLRLLLERLFKAGQQVVDVDPKGDHWGVRSSADGKGPGIGCLILGGEHGDLPLEPGSGELVAKLVVEERVSVLLDLSLFRKHEVASFMTAFLEAFYRLKAREQFRTPVMLFVDEADAIAPQKPQRGEERMLGAIEDIVRRGRQRGIGCTLVTQRSAVLNKNVLTQAQVMIAMRTIAPQDLAAMDAWIEVHGTPQQRATLMESLPSLPRGDAWVWSPGWPDDDGIFQRVHVDLIETFDSGATPAPGEKRVEPKERADVDLEALRRQMAATVERAKAADPSLLRKRIAELERELAKKPAAAPPPAKERRVEVPVVKDGQVKRLEVLFERVAGAADRLEKSNSALEAAMVALSGGLIRFKTTSPFAAPRPAVPPPPARRAIPFVPAPRAARAVADGEDPALRSGERRLLEVVAGGGPVRRTRAQIGTLAGFTPSGGTFGTYFGRLKRFGFVQELGDDSVAITDAGLKELGLSEPPAPMSGEETRALWRRSLRAGEWRMLEVLLAKHPHGVSREDLGEASGFTASGGTFGTYLGVLKRNGLVEERNGLLLASEVIAAP